MSLRTIIDRLKAIYCGHIGFVFSSIENTMKINWLRERVEKLKGNNDFGILNAERHLLTKVNSAVDFETFLQKKYVGQKRFSLEGGENTIPSLDALINRSADLGVGRGGHWNGAWGRLNVLVNTLGKTYEQILSEFEAKATPDLTMGTGDVKVSLGYSSQITTPTDKKVYLKLLPNPSHLEAVDPVVVGYVREG